MDARNVLDLSVEDALLAGCTRLDAERVIARLRALPATDDAALLWRRISREVLAPDLPFELHHGLYERVFRGWPREARGPAPAWTPTEDERAATNIAALMRERGFGSYEELLAWSRDDRAGFWEEMVGRLGIRLQRGFERVLDGRGDASVESPRWLAGARLNIAESCFQGDPERVAILHQEEDGPLERMTLRELDALSSRVAHGLSTLGLAPGDRVAIDMPMTAASVAIYLGIVKAGLSAVSIADSFSADEIKTRLRISGAKAIFTQDVIVRGGRTLALYERVCAADAPQAIVVPQGSVATPLRVGDIAWQELLAEADRSSFAAVERAPEDETNILFSSGTTGDPKAIPWSHTTPIKCAADGWLHHDIRPGDVVAWPTNLGWMMGPWLIYASLVNRATIALYGGAPGTRGFGLLVQDARVTMLGVVPSLVAAWRKSGCLHGLDWSSIRCFSSTGECSNGTDMLFLMARAGYKPIVEYCGGTEIGGGYITGTLVQPASPATFTTPALGLDLAILDEEGREAQNGEVFIVPPSIGLSLTLVNRDHHEVYLEGTPRGPRGETLRRHGDQIERLPGGFFRAHGRTDDTMKLSGIKVSSAEIERVLLRVPSVRESAAIAVPSPGGGPSLLVLFLVLAEADRGRARSDLLAACQAAIRDHLNPLYKVHDVVPVDALPRTASNKVMRRVLRARFEGDVRRT